LNKRINKEKLKGDTNKMENKIAYCGQIVHSKCCSADLEAVSIIDSEEQEEFIAICKNCGGFIGYLSPNRR
jgi:hypothetical protein